MSTAEEEAAKDFEEENSEDVVEGERPEHDWYWISAFSQKCTHCRVIKEVLFDENPIYRTRTAVKRVKKPKCYYRKPPKEPKWFSVNN